MKRVAIAADHAGFPVKEAVKFYLIKSGYEVKDYGTYSKESVDYPDFAHPLAKAVENHKHDIGITVCGSGNGINMTANKYQGIRSALCWNEEISRLARAHNDANICAIPGRFVSESEAELIVKTFLNTDFDGGRHSARIAKIVGKRHVL
ncbi:MAG: ribose 5-phosphate isomerase B [Bacteroidales bacterium]|nr:ribose 5-phosphate isomerase B [Bacteroidales bacterium]